MTRRSLRTFVPLVTGMLFFQGCAYISLDLGGILQFQPFEERVIKEGSAEKILVVEVLGPITTTALRDGLIQRQGTEDLHNQDL
ncbi:MAG TPA: hypothetical protein PK380_11030, partial [Deltaproteobacteria bacterium]|nr:hypothetical protein [Deltaproteobacteria bacterium]